MSDTAEYVKTDFYRAVIRIVSIDPISRKTMIFWIWKKVLSDIDIANLALDFSNANLD